MLGSELEQSLSRAFEATKYIQTLHTVLVASDQSLLVQREGQYDQPQRTLDIWGTYSSDSKKHYWLSFILISCRMIIIGVFDH